MAVQRLLILGAATCGMMITTGWAAMAPASTTSASREAADRSTPEGTVRAFFAAMSGPPGKARDLELLQSFFHPEARYWIVVPPSADTQGKPSIITTSPHKSLAEAVAGWQQNGFFEDAVFARTERFGNMAHVLLTYEIRRRAEDPQPRVRGLDSVQLYYDGAQWTIVSMYFQSESPGVALPTEYLPKR